MITNETKNKKKSTLETVNQKVEGKLKEKNKAKKIEKNYIKLERAERANLKQLSGRKFISQDGLKQIEAILLFDAKCTVTEAMEEVAVGYQKLAKWRDDFKKHRMDSLIVFIEKKERKEEKQGRKADSK